MNIRIMNVVFQDFVNVEKGEICSASFTAKSPFSHSDIIGIYGQNGSGKTAFIHALRILKYCLQGEPCPPYIDNFIRNSQDQSTFAFTFLMCDEKQSYMVEYAFSLKKTVQNDNAGSQRLPFYITDEKLFYKMGTDRKRLLISISADQDIVLLKPVSVQKGIEKHNKNIKINLAVMAGVSTVQGKSLLFSGEMMKHLRASYDSIEHGDVLKTIMEELIDYGHRRLHVFGNQENGIINLSIGMPITIHSKKSFGDILIPVNTQSKGGVLIPEALFKPVNKMVPNINKVLNAMVPGVTVEFENLGNELDKNGHMMTRSELVSVRLGRKIPIRYESEGIKKIICILPVFIGAFSDASMTIAVDELDAGIFEYLLGEMLRVFQDYGKGQLIFTSHNLRPLELLNRKFITFTTTNPKHRYIQMKGVKRSNNLRDVYYRDIQLGGTKEELYQETDRSQLAFALREAEDNE